MNRNSIIQSVRPWALRALALLAALAMHAHAGPGHDHGDEALAPVGSASPRVAGHSDLFEVVGIVEAGVMTIYLDRYGTNEPVTQGTVEVEAGAAKGPAQRQPDGTYRFEHPVLRTPGELAVSFTVSDGRETDLLAGDLKLPDPHAGHDHSVAGLSWQRWAGYGAVALALVLLGVLAGRSMKRRHGVALALVVTVVAATGLPLPAGAGPGHDHGDEPAAASGNSPARQPDGSVFLPKPSQRQLGVRTLVAQEKTLPRTVELHGQVVADPNAGGQVQPTQAGRVEPGPRGLPQLGQAVRKGETLAVIRVSSGAIDRANQLAQTADLKTALELARRKVARLEQLDGMVAQKDVESARAEVDGLTQRLAAVGASVAATEALVAPVSGVIAARHATAGQVVDAREVLFEIVDPTRLMVQAQAFDAALAANIASASIGTAPGSALALRLAGAGRVLRDGAVPLLFSTANPRGALPLLVGQPVRVVVQTRDTVKGIALPAGAVVKSPANQDMVWVHTAAETFQPRPVRALPLDGATVSVVDGLKAGDRVVTQGVPLVNQVR